MGKICQAYIVWKYAIEVKGVRKSVEGYIVSFETSTRVKVAGIFSLRDLAI